IACARLAAAGIEQYEISNFARPGFESRHNLKYWTRQPYAGFGVDAHSMLPMNAQLLHQGVDASRLATTDNYDRYLAGPLAPAELDERYLSAVSMEQALEESFFLGLRLNRGVDLAALRKKFGDSAKKFDPRISRLVREGLLARSGDNVHLTPRGRLLSNEVFARFIGVERPAIQEIPEAG